MFEDDFSFSKVGYVSSLVGTPKQAMPEGSSWMFVKRNELKERLVSKWRMRGLSAKKKWVV